MKSKLLLQINNWEDLSGDALDTLLSERHLMADGLDDIQESLNLIEIAGYDLEKGVDINVIESDIPRKILSRQEIKELKFYDEMYLRTHKADWRLYHHFDTHDAVKDMREFMFFECKLGSSSFWQLRSTSFFTPDKAYLYFNYTFTRRKSINKEVKLR